MNLKTITWGNCMMIASQLADDVVGADPWYTTQLERQFINLGKTNFPSFRGAGK
jgi:hypothetical protein